MYSDIPPQDFVEPKVMIIIDEFLDKNGEKSYGAQISRVANAVVLLLRHLKGDETVLK